MMWPVDASYYSRHLSFQNALLSETLNAVRDLRSFVALVRELCHRQGERLQISGNSQRPSVQGFKPDITNQSRRDVFRVLVVPAVQQGRTAARPSLRAEHVEQDLARDGAECGDDVGLANFPSQRLRTRRRVSDNELGVVRIHRERATDDHLAGEIAGLLQHVVDS